MKLYEAKNIITEVFENPFDKEKFSYFIRNLLKNLHPAEFFRSGYNIPKAFEEFIASYERLGKYEDEEGNLIDVLIVKLKRDHSIDYARSTQRNFVRWYLNDKGKDAALVAFHTEKSSEWRFSFIKMQYSLEKKADELTPAKRSSFMVGESGKSHTAQRQLIDLLKNDHAPYLSDIEGAFSIEAVSDEFYEKYKALLFDLVEKIEEIVNKDKTVKEELESKNISILNFSKKLLGQIVFLYFLQKKGWLGLDEKDKYGEGDKNFLRSLFNKTKPGENFFNDYLEYLFYDALSKKRVTDYYARFKTRIPFLNGGLFDPIKFYDWQKTDIVIPNEIFSNRKGDEEGTGILDIFDLYNFTVKEDEPLETEVAIDPEMLGKVFERMLEVTERKSKGAFYTPREIVHYMAQQSLLYFLETELKEKNVAKEDLETFIHYGEHIIDKDIAIEEGKLKQTANKQTIPDSIRENADAIDKALENIKICDPAVGSGAFPVGIMNEIVKLRKLLTPFIIATPQERGKQSLENRTAYNFKSNAIQNSIYGVDIDAGAVEIAKLRLWLSMVVDEERIDNIEPLPNLEYKIVQGNSLINMPDGSIRNGDLEKHIEELTGKYKIITDKDKKQEQKEIIDGKIQQLLASASEFAGYDIDFDFKLYFHEIWNEKKGFDVVIANPPYIRISKLPNKDVLKSIGYETFDNSGDIYCLFFEKSNQILKRNGNLCFITSNQWLQTNYGKKLREYFVNNLNPLMLINFGGLKVFQNATVDTSVFIGKRDKCKYQLEAALFKNDYKIEYSVEEYFNKNKIILSNLTKGKWFIVKDSNIKIKTKIEQRGLVLENWDINIYRGMLTGINKAFIIDNKTKEKLINIDSNSLDIIKPVLRGRDVHKYHINWAELYLIATKNSINIESYPAILEHLKGFGEKIKERSDQGENWWNLRACNYYDIFEKPKIIYPETTVRRSEFYLDKEGFYADKTCFIIQGSNLHFLNAVLASKLMEWYLETELRLLGKSSIQYSKQFIEKVPIPLPEVNTNKKFILIIDIVHFLKKQQNNTMSFYFEQLIDGMVYELYFENEIKQAGCDILKYLNDLPEISDEMQDDEKLKIITKVFNKLYDKESPVRKNLFFMDSVEEVAIIKKSLEK